MSAEPELQSEVSNEQTQSPETQAAQVGAGQVEVSADQLLGLTDTEQFLRIFSAPRAGTRLWEQWHTSANDTARAVMELLAEQGAEENGVSLEEARRRVAAEKLLNDLGPDFAARFMKNYRADRFAESRSLRPMTRTVKKKK